MDKRWSDLLWDCKDKLEEYFDHASQTILLFSNYLKRVSFINQRFSELHMKTYKEVIKTLPNADYFDNEYQDQTCLSLFRSIFAEHLVIANQSDYHAELCLKFSNDLRSQANIFIDEKNKVLHEFSVLESSLQQTLEEYENKKSSVILNFDKKIDRKFKSTKTQSLNSITTAMEKITATEDMKEIKAAIEDNKSKASDFIKKYIKNEIDKKLDILEVMNKVNWIKTFEIIKEYLHFYKNKSSQIIEKSLDYMIESLNAVSYDKENEIVAQSFHTGYKFSDNPEVLIKELENISKYKLSRLKKSKNIDKNSRVIDLNSIPPAKFLSTIRNHILFLFECMKKIDDMNFGNRKLMLTMTSNTVNIDYRQKLSKELDSDYEDLFYHIQKYCKIYLDHGGNQSDLGESSKFTKPRSRLQSLCEETSPCDFRNSSIIDCERSHPIITLTNEYSYKFEESEPIPIKYLFNVNHPHYILRKDYLASVEKSPTENGFVQLFKRQKFFVNGIKENYFIATPFGDPHTTLLIESELLDLSF